MTYNYSITATHRNTESTISEGNEGDYLGIIVTTTNTENTHRPYLKLTGGGGFNSSDTDIQLPLNRSIDFYRYHYGLREMVYLTSWLIELYIFDDILEEENETLYAQLFTDSTQSTQIGDTFILPILDNDLSIYEYKITTSYPDFSGRLIQLDSVGEGIQFTTTINTNGIEIGTQLFWSLSGTGINISDFSSGDLSGSGVTNQDGEFSFTHTLKEDEELEGNETLEITLFSDVNRTQKVGNTHNLLIHDNSIPVITTSDQSINEGETFTTTFRLPSRFNYDTYYWLIYGNNITSTDFESASQSEALNARPIANYLTNNIPLQPYSEAGPNSFASLSHTTTNDFKTEGIETLYIKLFSDAEHTTQVGNTATITINDMSKTLSPTYTISPSATSINEGETLTTTISTTNLAIGTTIYWSFSGNGITTADLSNVSGGIGFDIDGGALTGSAIPDSNGNISFTHTFKNEDLLNEGDETLYIKLFSDSSRSNQVGETATVTIVDMSQVKTYTINSVSGNYLETPGGSINEGDVLTTNVSTTNVSAGTTLYWSLSGTGITSADFSSGALTGAGTVDNNGDFSFSHSLTNDLTTEGTETLNIKLFSDSSRSTQVGSTSIMMFDTSQTLSPTYTISPSATSINEGSTLTTSISTTSVAAGTTLYWSLSGTGITSNDFSSGALTGSGSVGSDRSLSFSHTLANDVTTEGSETLNIKLFSDSARSTQVGNTSSVSIVDTSITTPSTFHGTLLDDTFISSSENDLIIGSFGTDTVKYSGSFKDYSFNRISDTLEITDLRTGSNDGIDTLKEIELIQFTDQTVEESKVDIVKTYSGNFRDYKFYNKGNGSYEIKNSSTGTTDDITGLPLLTFTEEATTSSFRDVSAIVDIKGVFDQVTGLNTDSGRMFRLYNASFKRLPDADGLEYWINQFSSGANSIRVVASSFLGSAEFTERYGENVSDSTYVNTLYTNVLGRDADTGGLNYWLGQLDSGAETRYEVLLGFAESAENKALFTDMTGFA